MPNTSSAAKNRGRRRALAASFRGVGGDSSEQALHLDSCLPGAAPAPGLKRVVIRSPAAPTSSAQCRVNALPPRPSLCCTRYAFPQRDADFDSFLPIIRPVFLLTGVYTDQRNSALRMGANGYAWIVAYLHTLSSQIELLCPVIYSYFSFSKMSCSLKR